MIDELIGRFRGCQRRCGAARRRGGPGGGSVESQGSPAGRAQQPPLPRPLSIPRAQTQPTGCRNLTTSINQEEKEKEEEEEEKEEEEKEEEEKEEEEEEEGNINPGPPIIDRQHSESH